MMEKLITAVLGTMAFGGIAIAFVNLVIDIL